MAFRWCRSHSGQGHRVIGLACRGVPTQFANRGARTRCLSHDGLSSFSVPGDHGKLGQKSLGKLGRHFQQKARPRSSAPRVGLHQAQEHGRKPLVPKRWKIFFVQCPPVLVCLWSSGPKSLCPADRAGTRQGWGLQSMQSPGAIDRVTLPELGARPRARSGSRFCFAVDRSPGLEPHRPSNATR
ncbi:hypothetical protein VTI74DRAFT_8094 [Chaetomium olivicolor]